MTVDDWSGREPSILSMKDEYDDVRGLVRDSWDSDKLRFDEKASRVVKQLLQAVGLELSTTTKEMDRLDHRFVCLKCTFGSRCDGSRVVRIWSWRDAVSNFEND